MRKESCMGTKKKRHKFPCSVSFAFVQFMAMKRDFHCGYLFVVVIMLMVDTLGHTIVSKLEISINRPTA